MKLPTHFSSVPRALVALATLLANGCHHGAAPSGAASTVSQISAGTYNACARRTDGSVWCWGRCTVACNGPGVAVGNDAASAEPQPVRGLTDATSVAVGESAACAARGDGTVWCWGGNYDGQLGRIEPERSYVPLQVPGVSEAVEVAAARNMMCARRRDGTAVAWGGPLLGADRNPAEQARRTATAVGGVAHAVAVFANGDQCCVRDADGLACWVGAEARGGAGRGPDEYAFAYGPAARRGAPGTRAVGQCGCTLDGRGTLSCESRALPGARVAPGFVQPEPQRNRCSIDALADVAAFSASTQYGCAVQTDGRVQCWGTLISTNDPVDAGPPLQRVPIDAPARQVELGRFGTAYVLDARGRVWAWGQNYEHAIPGQRAQQVVAVPVRVLP